MAKYFDIIKNSRTGQRVRIEATTYQALENKKRKMFQLWEQEYYEQQFRNFKLSKIKEINDYNKEIELLTEIIKRNIDSIFNFKKLYKELDASNYNPKFKSKLIKPDRAIIFLHHEVPWKNPFIEMFSKKAYEKRVRLETEALAIFEQKLIDYENALLIERQDFMDEIRAYRANIEKQNIEIREKLSRFLNRDINEVKLVLEEVINVQNYPEFGTNTNIGENTRFDYIPDNSLITVSRKLPSIDEMPKYSAFRWSDRKKDLEKVEWKRRDLIKLHENVIFQLSLLSIRNIFDSFPAEVVNEVAFNGWLHLVNPTTGRDEKINLVYIKVNRSVFMRVNLLNVDHRACITSLNGDISPSFTEYTYTKPKQDTKKVDQKVQSTRKTSEYRTSKDDSHLADSKNKDYVSNSIRRNRKKTTPDFDLDFDD
jgi:restriction system protein